MKIVSRTLVTLLIITFVVSACNPAPTATPLPPTQTEVPPTPTVTPTPTLRPEKNISFTKPVRVSASWVVDPPERAVNGNLGDWWGAGGPPPAWIEVDLQGLYAVSKVRVINQGPTGQVTYKVMGRGLGKENQLLHVFEGFKSENQTLEFSPETPWEDIATIRVEIPNGSGWVGLREIQVFSREDPRPLPASAEAAVPLFLSQVQPAALERIAPDNAILMKQLAMLGRGPLNELTWSPDGKTLAAASPLGVWLYDPAASDGAPRLLEGHTREVLSVAFSLDGSMILSGSQDGTVKQWDAAKGVLKRTIWLWNDFSYEVGDQKRDAEVWSMAFSPDRELLAAGSLDGTLQLWNLTTGKPRSLPKGHTNQITSLAFSPDGSLLASSGQDGAIYVWDVEASAQRLALDKQGQVQSLAFSMDGKTLVYSPAGKSVQLRDIETGLESIELTDLIGVISLAFTPDGRTLTTSSFDGIIRLWDGESGNTQIFRERAGWIMNMAYSPDGATLATYAWDGALRLWDTATASYSGDLATHTSPVTSIAFGPDGTLLVSGSEDGAVRLWNVETNSLLLTMQGHVTRVFSVAFSPDGELLASGGMDKTIRLWDPTTGNQVRVLSGHESMVRSVAFSPDSKLVASGGTDQTVRLWDAATGEERAVLSDHTSEVESVAFSPDGKWLVSASADKTVRVWDVATGKEAGILKGHLSYVLGAAFSPDGAVIASVGGDHWLRAWDVVETLGVVNGKDHFTPIGHGGWVLSVAFSPDGAVIASANVSTTSYLVAPGEIHLYSADTGFPYALLRGHPKRVTSVAFSPDGKLLASGSADGSIRLWGVRKDSYQPTADQAFETVSQTSTPTASPPPVAEDPFIGEWTAYDSYDGSSMTMSITREGDQYYITQVDDKASVCGKDSAGRPQFSITIQFTGKAEGNVLDASFTSATCMSTPPTDLVLNLSNSFTYNAPTETLLDTLGKYIWKRR